MSIVKIYYHNENIYNVEKKPPERPPNPPLYHSRFEHQVRRETKSCKDAHRTMGYAKTPLQKPDEFLKKNCGVRYRATKSAPVRLCTGHRPPVPKKDETGCANQQATTKSVNFKVENIKKVVNTSPRKVRPRYADTRKGDYHDLEKSGLMPVYKCQPKYGKIPQYLQRRKKELDAQKQHLVAKSSEQKQDCLAISQEERLELLKGLKKNWENLQQEYQSLPLLIDTVPKMIRKAKLEKGLKELEKDILTIESNPYIYVYDDEDQYN
ncbi:enkurin-like [Toxorhynchites rutilus septentrionalis]|uniref:enkurin-like n=1 Tax=Toxorhynchites rutilus septentrionalis TaxID=329112 RepID=UPI00247A421F|nr:enkurin-like [Toxorhynchites rutilus septentrionalis]